MSSQVDGALSDDVVASFRSDLNDFFEKNNLSPADCCIVGSVCLSVRELREHGDIDICVAPQYRMDIEGAADLIELASNKYEHIGISDETIIYDETYHDIIDGIKIVRPEIEYSHKLYRQWDKDCKDITLLERYKQEKNDWNEELVIDNYTPSISHTITRAVRSIRRDGMKKTFEHGVEFMHRHGPFSRRTKDKYKRKPTSVPARALQSYKQAGLRKTIQRGIRLLKITDPTGITQRYSRPRHKIKLGSLAEDKLLLKYNSAELIGCQYSRNEFVRYDLLVALAAIKEHKDGMQGGFDLYQNYSRHADTRTLEDFLDVVDDYFEHEKLPAVPIGYSSEILDIEIAACSLYNQTTETEVDIKNSATDIEQHPISWFEERDFTQDELNHLKSELSAVLNEHGVLFEVIIWPPASDHFDEIINNLVEEEIIHSCTLLRFDKKTFADFVYDLYATQIDIRWEYIDNKIDRISREPSDILSIQIELPYPRIREENSHEMKEIKERYRARYNPQIGPENPNSRQTIHAADNYVHNRKTRTVLEQYRGRALHTDEIISLSEPS